MGVRHIQFFMATMGLLVAYGMRTTLSVAIIAMMDEHPPSSSIPTYPLWELKESILSSFFWGYIVTQIGAGHLSKVLGPKWLLFTSVLVNGIIMIAIPAVAAGTGEVGVIVCRVVQGLFQGFLFPSIHTALSAWTPPSELSKVGSFVYTGGPLGTAVSLPITGLIANSTAGWPVGFYVYGCAGLVWCALWAWLGSNGPEVHPSISKEERDYIVESLAKKENASGNVGPIPWRHILTSLPFWAIFISHCGQNWSFFTLLTEIPSYMSSILKSDIKSNGFLSAVPYLVLWLLNFVFSYTSDYLIDKKYLSVGNTRKLFNSIGLLVPAVALTWLGFVTEGQNGLALTLLIIAVGFDAGTFIGFLINHIDIAPNYGGVLMGITNSISNILSIIGPLSLNWMGRSEDDPILWRMVFCIAAALNAVTGIFYIVFASGEIQSWNYAKPSKKNEESTEKGTESIDLQ